VGLTDLSSVLWRMRELLELLLFKLEEEQLLVASGRGRWLAHATREVELVLEQVRQAEIVRAAEAQAVAEEYGVRGEASLSELAAVAPTPWNELLRQHRQAFVALTAEIGSLADTNKELLTAGLRATRETLLAVGGSVGTYGRRGESISSMAGPRLVDEAI
jgi:hypothetical protein